METSTKKEKNLIPYIDVRGTTKLKWEGGGELPDILSGTYTSIREAQKAADSYIANIKGTSNAKSKDRETV